MMRLNKYLARCGVNSRRKCDQMIRAGRVAVNGNIVTALGVTVNEYEDEIRLDGEVLKLSQTFIYILLNKPSGYVTSVDDAWGRKTVLDLLNIRVRVFPVGRLDMNTEGLLLLTNDGELAYKLTHPRFKVDKVYRVYLDREMEVADLQKLSEGVVLEEGKTSPCCAEFASPQSDKKIIKIVLHEGRKRQVRRMMKSLGYRVEKLVRVKFANLSLEGIKQGQWRELTQSEIKRLKEIVGLGK